MITLSPFLRANGNKNSSSGEKQAEALNRIVSVLLQGIALHGFEYQPEAFAAFGTSIQKVRAEFEHASEEGTALLLTGAAIRLLQDHNGAAAQYLEARQNEMEAVIALLSQTVLEVVRASPEVMVRMKEIERDIAQTTQIDGIAAARARLAACLAELRADTFADPRKRKSPTWPEAETDYITGLPDSAYATRAVKAVWNRRMDSYVALFGVDRLDTINMRFGFPAGDQMLLLLSQHIAQQLTPGDQLFRWRGPCLAMLIDRRVPEAMLTAEVARMVKMRLEAAIAFREREVMVPISATWSLFPLSTLASTDDLFRRMNEFASSRARGGRQVSAAAT